MFVNQITENSASGNENQLCISLSALMRLAMKLQRNTQTGRALDVSTEHDCLIVGESVLLTNKLRSI